MMRFKLNKKCSACNTVYSREGFYKNKSRKDGLSDYCIGCTKSYRNQSKIRKKLRNNMEETEYYNQEKDVYLESLGKKREVEIQLR